MPPEIHSPGGENPKRLPWLDVFRGAAVVAMVEAHVVNTFLASALREAAWFGWLNWFNGLVAPAFLFIAGWAQGMGFRLDPAKPLAFRRKLKRLLGVALLGFTLHFPWVELSQRRWADAVRVGMQVDVLPCLAAALVVVLAGQWFARLGGRKFGPWMWFATLAALTAGVVWLAPRAVEWSGAVPLIAWVNQTTGSLFPLLPWAGFVFAGAILGSIRRLPLGALFAVCGLMKLLSWLLAEDRFSAVSPAFFCERLAWVAALAALCQWITRRGAPVALIFAGRESLVMYPAHLLIISWIAGARLTAAGLGWGAVIAMYAVVLALTWAVALGWAKWRTWKAKRVAQSG